MDPWGLKKKGLLCISRNIVSSFKVKNNKSYFIKKRIYIYIGSSKFKNKKRNKLNKLFTRKKKV